MGGPDEQHQGSGGGSGDEGIGVRLSDPLPVEEEQPRAPVDWTVVGPTGLQFSHHDFNAHSDILYYHEDSEKNELLRTSDALKDHRTEIAAFFADHTDSKERGDFIKAFFNNTYVEKILANGQRAGYRAWDDVLTLWRGSYPSREKVEKRIGELIAADRYLNRAEKVHYPVYQAQVEQRKARWKIADEIRSIIDDYVNFKTQLGEKEQCSEILFARTCTHSFGVGDKKNYVRTMEGSFVLPTLRDAMQAIIKDNTHLTERCEAMLAELNGLLAAPLEPTYDELNPPKKEYRFSLGDKVYLGSQEYELLAFDEQTVRLFDATFPLINKELPRDEFDRMLAENPLNDHLLQVVEEVSAPAQDDMSLEEAKRLINEYCTEVFDQEADFSDLHYVDLAFSSTSDSEHTVEVSADLIDCRLIYQVDNEVVASLQCHDLNDLSEHLANLDFDQMIAFAEEQYEKQQDRENDDFSDIDPATIREALAESGIVDGKVVDPNKLDANPFIQQVVMS